MATIIQKPNKTIEIRFRNADGEVRSLYPGKIPKRTAESIGSKIDHIVSRQIVGADPDRDVAEWLAELPAKLYRKFVNQGLAAPRIADVEEAEPTVKLAPTIKEWTDQYIKNHPGKASTVEQLEITARSFCKRFGNDRRIDAINAGDAEDFRKWLQSSGNERKAFKTGLAEGTVRRRIGRCKQFFNSAIKHELITRNPFAGEASATGGNPERLVMVPAEWIEACIRKAPCEDWRIILAFARYAGMRSHETRIQKWEDIDLANNTMLVRSNKSPAVRRCPIFPELRPHLLRAREMAPEGAVYVQTRYGVDDNILTTMVKIIEKAGLVPWQKPMQNLRATRETELLAHYPAKDVTSWLGNSPEVANNHYAMTMQASFERAITDGAKVLGVTAGTAKSRTANNAASVADEGVEKTPLNPPPTVQEMAGKGETPKSSDSEKHENIWQCLAKSLHDVAISYPART
jgi:integrase